MYKKGSKSGTTRFSVKADKGAREVLLAGDFTNWAPVRMKKAKTGSFGVTLAIPRGSHEYKFIVDGCWVTDPDNAAYAANPYGTVNSLLRVE